MGLLLCTLEYLSLTLCRLSLSSSQSKTCKIWITLSRNFQNANRVPYFCRFYLYARKNPPPLSNHNNNAAEFPQSRGSNRGSGKRVVFREPKLANLRILCLSEPERSVNPLELQEDFVEITRRYGRLNFFVNLLFIKRVDWYGVGEQLIILRVLIIPLGWVLWQEEYTHMVTRYSCP